MSVHTVRETMQLEVDNWACIQKQDGGWDMLDSRSKRQLQDTGSSPNMWIIPRGMKPYIALDKAATSYFMRGPDGNALLDSAKNGQNVSYVDTSNNCQIFESKAFQMPGQEEPLDLLYRDRSVGEYYLMVDHLPAISYKDKDYKTEQRTIYVYDESADRMKPITLKKALDECDWSESGYYGTEGDDTDPENNMFYCYDVETKPHHRSIKRVNFLGELEEEYLSDDIITKMTDVIVKIFGAEKEIDTEPNQKALFKIIQSTLGKKGLMTDPQYCQRLVNEAEKPFTTFLQNAVELKQLIGAPDPYGTTIAGNLEPIINALESIVDAATKARIIGATALDPETYLKDVHYTFSGEQKITPNIENRFNALSNALGDGTGVKAFYMLSVLITNAYMKILEDAPRKEAEINKIVGRFMNIGQSKTNILNGLWAMAFVYTQVKDEKKPEKTFDELFETAHTDESNTLIKNETGIEFRAGAPTYIAGRFTEESESEFGTRTITLNDTTLRGGQRPGKRGMKRPAEVEADTSAMPQRFGARVFRDGLEHPNEEGTEGDMDIDAAATGDTANVFTVNGVELNLGHMFKKRFESIANTEANNVRRAVKLSILGMPFDKDSMKNLAEYNVPVPVGVLCVRPFITHNMGTAILTTSGAEVGETLVGRADFQLTDNVVQKMHYGNFTFYARNIIYHPEKVLVVTDIISRRYLGGNDMKVFKNRDELDSFRNGVANSHKSFIFMVIPCSENAVKENPIDLTGKFEDTNSDLDLGPLHFPGAQTYANKWGFTHHQSNQNNSYFEYYNSLNTVCYQGHQMNYDPHQENFSRVTLNTGHWGYRVYEGCKAVRSGAMKLLKEVDYNSGSGPVPNVPLGY